MKNDISTAELLSKTNLSEVLETVVDTSSGFTILTKLLGLDRSSDFRSSNLNGVDFSNSDLRGYNFSGADLRNSFGVDVKIDDTTILDGADLQGSCFASFHREVELFRKNPKASQMYDSLQQGDPLEVSSWIHARYGHGKNQSTFLKDATDETASILCQKLLMDDIDLTKRSDLFHYLKSITGSERSLRELVLRIIATHLSNLPVAQKFITIAGQLFSNDPVVVQAILTLTQAENERVRETAFLTLEKTRFALDHLGTLQSAFLDHKNTGIRKKALRKSAIGLGRKHLSAINLRALGEDVDLEEILDFDELMQPKTMERIASTILLREQKIRERIEDIKKDKRSVSTYEINAIKNRHQEVVSSTPVLRLIYALNNPKEAKEAKARIERQKLSN